MSALATSPFEYWLLSQSPRTWLPVDSLVVGLGLFLELTDSTGRYDLTRGFMHDLLPEPVVRFMLNNGSHWEAPLDGSEIPIIPIPDPTHFLYIPNAQPYLNLDPLSEPHLPGSNHWAVNGSRTKNGKALIACDMHLPFAVPNFWYRAAFVYPGEDGKMCSIWGATLPGLPFIVVGSDGSVAWGFTNACVDTTDAVMVSLGDHIRIYPRRPG